MKKMSILAVVGLAASVAGAAQFTPGNLVVVRLGDGEAPLSNAAQRVFLDEYTPAGALVQSIAMPTTLDGSNRRLTMSGTATSEGTLTRSADGRYLTLGGYDAAPGTASIASSTTANVNRVAARVGFSGDVDTSTAITDAFSGNNIRSVVSNDGSQFWMTGGNSGVRYIDFGGGPTTQINTGAATNNTNTRVVNIFDGQLYVSSAQGGFLGLHTVGAGLPTATGDTTSLFFATGTNTSPYDYYMADANTVYVADDSAGFNGIQRWVFDGSDWTRDAIYNSGLLEGARIRQLTGTRDDTGAVILYATTVNTGGSSNIVSIVDAGATPTFTIIATADANTVFRGIDFSPIPAPGTAALMGMGLIVASRRRR
ncbi:MAG: PEP-CTERM sorting domain-containing protein [Phycisphaeraceae bacterium]|nr:PEP-CTERM sorting domain-containing protein [Phycisphaeraceae bacterium]